MTKVLLLTVLLLFGCAQTPITPAPVVITKVERVVTLPPAELLTPPPQVQKPDPDKATQADVAQYLVSIYQRMRAMENQLLDLAKWAASITQEQPK